MFGKHNRGLIRLAVLAGLFLPAAGCATFSFVVTTTPAADPYKNVRPTTAAVGVTMPDAKDFMHPWDVETYIERVTEFAGLPVMNDGDAFVGDSLTDYGRWAEAYPALRVRNFGIAGDTTVGLQHRLQQVIDAKPSAVYLMIGTNDLEFGRTPAQIAANIEDMLDRLHAGLPGATVYVQSILPRQPEYAGRVVALNALLKAAAEKRGLTYIDLYSHFVADGRLDPKLSLNELHLAGEGYARWRSVLNDYMYFRTQTKGD